MQNEQQAIEDILMEFNFHRVQRTMDALNWTWTYHCGIPDLMAMKKTARYLLDCCKEAPDTEASYTTSTGGFEASRSMFPGDAKRYYSLKFIVSDWNNYD